MKNICYITAIYGNYESTCKAFVTQSIDSDFICFTDNNHIKPNDWIIDTNPYHITHKSKLDYDNKHNSLNNNKHTFNICKYYKQAFQNIPRLKQYDVIVWIDGTIEITNEFVSQYILKHIYKYKIIAWEHQHRRGILANELQCSLMCDKYTSTFFSNQSQPMQNVCQQYIDYIVSGYNETLFQECNEALNTKHYGVWITCFIAFLNNDLPVSKFLEEWYNENLIHTTQDQLSFPFVVQKTNIYPFTLPNKEIKSEDTHFKTDFYIKNNHGK